MSYTISKSGLCQKEARNAPSSRPATLKIIAKTPRSRRSPDRSDWSEHAYLAWDDEAQRVHCKPQPGDIGDDRHIEGMESIPIRRSSQAAPESGSRSRNKPSAGTIKRAVVARIFMARSASM